MKKNTLFSKIGIVGLFILLLSSVSGFGQTPEPRFRTYHTGQAFTAITVDLNKNVWAGTDRQGIFFLSQAVSTPQPTFSAQTIGTAPVVGTLRINSLATDKTGNVWVAHAGSSGAANGGGVEKITGGSSSQHFTPARDARGFSAQGLPYMERDGTATLNSQQVVVDKNNTVWIAQRYHDLLSSPNYFVTPGTFSFRNADATTPFNSVSTYKDFIDGTMDPNIPYPAYTYNPTATQTAQTRIFNIISADSTHMWTGHYGYEVHQTGQYIPARLLKYTVAGQFVAAYKMTQAKFPNGGVFNGVYANNKKGTWVTRSVAGYGFSVFKNGQWFNVNDPKIVPPGTKFNDRAIWGDKFGKVYLGTDKGLIVYDGTGPIQSYLSYTLYTNTPYASSRNITDTDMLSNNITAGATEGDLSPYFSWIATPSGIMRLFLPPGEVTVLHVVKKEFPNNATLPSNGAENYIPFADLHRETATYTPAESEKPAFAVDGTQSSVFRIKTIDAVGFYDTPSKYKIRIFDNIGAVGGEAVDDPNYIERYGKFELKPIADYGNGLTLQTLEYVDFIYTHPKYIDPNDYITDKYYANFRLVVKDIHDIPNPITIFDHPIKFCLPPVLLSHGVWSNTASMENIKTSLLARGYSDNEISSIFRTNADAAENPFMMDSHEIPNAIKGLITKALGVKVSAGKVDMIVHSRGGLYTRAYIEEINPAFPYEKNINALITLNTPHSGSQAANAILDKRIAVAESSESTFDINVFPPWTTTVIPAKTVGQLIKSLPLPPSATAGDWGAKVLTVVNDNLSHKPDDANFIDILNSSENLQKLYTAEVPIHAVATNFNACNLLGGALCSSSVTILLTSGASWLVGFKGFWESFLGQAGAGSTLNEFLEGLYGGTSDVIVPTASMRGGLGANYTTTLPGEEIAHVAVPSIIGASGVCDSYLVHNRIFELFKQNVTASNSNFTTTDLAPPALTYNFQPQLAPNYVNRAAALAGGLVIVPPSFVGSMTSGSTVSFDVFQQDLDKINIVYEYIGTGISFFETRVSPLVQYNNFTFTIPQDFIGSLKITAYGFFNNQLIMQSVYNASIQAPAGATLQSIRYENPDITIMEQTTSEFKLLGMYSDGIERRINDITGITYVIDDPAIIQRTNAKTVKGLALGETTQVATVGALTTSLNVFVIANPSLLQSLVTSYYSEYVGLGPVSVKWDVFQQYRAQKFTLERSSDNITFAPLDEQAAAGTNYTPMNYSYVDNTTDELIYYRLKLLDLDNVVTYSNVIMVTRGTLANPNFVANDNKMVLTPNPLAESTGRLSINSSVVDSNAVINIYNITGRLISSKKCDVKGGSQTISFDMPIGASKGMYLVQLKTKEFTKTLKLLYQK